MPHESPLLDVELAHRHFAAECFNRAWTLVEKADRTPADDEAMLLAASASLWHWLERTDRTDRKADGDNFDARPNPDHVYFAVPDLEAVHGRAARLPCQQLDNAIALQSWGERSFHGRDPFGNPICFVNEQTILTVRR